MEIDRIDSREKREAYIYMIRYEWSKDEDWRLLVFTFITMELTLNKEINMYGRLD